MLPDKKRILCVYDGQGQRELLKTWLELQQYEVVTTATCAEGCRLLKEGGFALVLFDDWLNGRDELIAAMRAYDPSLPLIIFSTDIDPDAESLALAAGAHAFFSVPFDLRQLAETTARLIACRQPPARPDVKPLLDKCEELQMQAARVRTKLNATTARATLQLRQSQEMCQRASLLLTEAGVRPRRGRSVCRPER